MSGKSYSYEEACYRLMHYKGTVYKFKIEFSSGSLGKNNTQKILTPSESDQVYRTIGVLVHQRYRRTDLTNTLQTKDFLIRCSERPWKTGKKVGFRLRGKELAVHDYMFLLNVKSKQKGVTVAKGDVALNERPSTSRTNANKESQHVGTAQNSAAEKQESSSRQRRKSQQLEQETFTDQIQKTAEESEPLPRMMRSTARQQCELPSRQTQKTSRLSPKLLRKSQKLSRKEKSPKQIQKSQEVSPRCVRRSLRLLPSEKSPMQMQQNSAISPRKFRATAKLSEQVKSPGRAKRRPEVSPRIFHKGPKSFPARSSQSSPTKSPEKHGIAEVSPRFLRRSPRFRVARSNQNSPLKSPERHGILGRFSPNSSSQRLHSHSVGSDDDTIIKRLRSNSAKLPTSDVTTTEKLLHPLDKEFVRRDYEQEELRLRNLAKPSTSSAERKAWLSTF